MDPGNARQWYRATYLLIELHLFVVGCKVARVSHLRLIALLFLSLL